MSMHATPTTHALTAQAVSAQFASRPSLEAVIQPLLGAAIAQTYPDLIIDLSRTRLATPTGKGGWTLAPLMTVIQRYLAEGGPLDFNEVDHLPYYLSDVPPKRLKLPGTETPGPDMKVIEALIKTLPPTLPIALQDALAEYWNAPSDTTVSRWRWLSDMLRSTLRASTLRQPELDEAAWQTLDQLITTPDRAQRLAKHGDHSVLAYGLETTLSSNGQADRQLTEHMVLTRAINGVAPALLCAPNGQVESFASMDALLQAWGERLAAHYQASTITCNRYEPEGSIFDHQASMILNQQLTRLGALQLPLGQDLQTLHTLYLEITDPGLCFLDALQAPAQTLASVRAQLPQNLRGASPADRARYRHYTLALAGLKQRAQDPALATDIEDIQRFTVAALQREMGRETAVGNGPDQIPTQGLNPDDVQLTFVVAAGYPGGAGIVEHVRMSLTELAIRNLSGRPSGEFTLAHRQGTPLPAWLTPAYVIALVERVDIGQHYPHYLKDQLLSDTAKARAQETLFAEHLSVQLPLLALELSLKREAGVTPVGARMVECLMQATSSEQQLDGRAVVIRHLALLHSPAAQPDVVSNMYIIEFQDVSSGPHLLFRPLYAQPLHEYASHADLLAAIAAPGDMQASILTWLPDNTRPIYDNGGFHEPHYLRFGQGDEFAPRETPPPATLALDGINEELQQCLVTGSLMQYLFSDNARALVQQADRASVSNSESRWQTLREGSGLLFFSVIQPVLRGPAMLMGWLLAITTSLTQDIQALGSQNPKVREQGSIDLLLNVALLLLDFPATPITRRPLPLAVTPPASATALPRRSAEQWPVPAPAQIRQGTVALPGELPQGNHTALDFSFAQAHQRLTHSQRMRLQTFRVTPPATLPQPVLNGPRKGLYLIGTTWHARVDGELFQVSLGHDASVVIVDPADPDRSGPYLRTQTPGTWTIDTRLRLRGGMPLGRIAAERQRKAMRISQLQTEYEQFLKGQASLQSSADEAQAAMDKADKDPTIGETQRARIRKQFDSALHSQTAEFQKILDSAKERGELGIALPLTPLERILENTVKNTRKHVVVAENDRQALYRANQRFTREGPALYLAVLGEPASYRQFLQRLLEINERSIHWLELKDRSLEQLFELSPAGAESATGLTADRSNEISALAVKDLHIRCLKRLIVKDVEHPLFNALNTIVDPLQEHVRTHSELNSLELPGSDRLNVLESLVEHYGSALDALQGLGILDAEVLDHTYSSKLFTLVEALYQDASQRLASEIKPAAQAPKRLPKRPMSSHGAAPKRVIKTRRKGTFIGELKPIGNVDIVEVRAEGSDQLLGMYSQSGDEWVEFVQAPAPQPPAPTRSLSVVKGQARKLLAMLQDHLNRGEAYRKISRHPQEVQEILQYEAVRYDTLATELHRAIEAQPEASRSAADQALVVQLREAYSRLNSQGQALRLQLCLQLPPTHANLEYLIDQQQANVALLGKRIQLGGPRRDFIQEYAINDAKGFTLWYAHFHYPGANTPKADYTAAHLKTREQRRESYYSLLAKAQSPQAIVNVHRGLIGKQLAERWFLSFES